MSEILNKLAASERITQWIDPFDPILETVTGQEAPNHGDIVREPWDEAETELPALTGVVSRLIVPSHIALKGTMQAIFVRRTDVVRLNFEDESDWHACFPVDRTEITDEFGGERRTWAGVGITNLGVGLAVLSGQQRASEGAFALVQPVPEDVMGEILALIR